MILKHKSSPVILKAREEHKFLDTDRGILSPREVCEFLETKEVLLLSEELIDVNSLLLNKIEEKKLLEEEISTLRERIKTASTDDIGPSYLVKHIGTNFRFSDFSNPANYTNDGDFIDFFCGTDRKTGYSIELDFMNNARLAIINNESSVIGSIEVDFYSEPETFKFIPEEIYSSERCAIMYKELKEFKSKYPEDFSKWIGRYLNLYNDLESKQLSNPQIKYSSSF